MSFIINIYNIYIHTYTHIHIHIHIQIYIKIYPSSRLRCGWQRSARGTPGIDGEIVGHAARVDLLQR